MIELSPIIKKKHKKGSIGIIIVMFMVIGFVLVLGLFIGIGASAVAMFMDEFVPEMKAIGSIGSANVTEYVEYTIVPIDIFIDTWTWVGGILYLISFIGLFGIAVGFRTTMNRWFMGIFVLFALLMLFVSIFVSNAYQDLYEDGSDFGTQIKNQKLLSFLVLNSPLILCLIIFISGIVLFTGAGKEDLI